MQRLVWQNGGAVVIKRHFAKGFVAGEHGHVVEAVAYAQPDSGHKFVQALGGRPVAIAIGFVAAQVGDEVQVAAADSGVGEEVAEEFAVAEGRADKGALLESVVAVVTQLDILQQLVPVALAVVQFGAHAHAPVGIAEKAPEIGQADRFGKYADSDRQRVIAAAVLGMEPRGCHGHQNGAEKP